ncbi:MAG: PKD domain-containing protein [Bacteroidia bacterium]
MLLALGVCWLWLAMGGHVAAQTTYSYGSGTGVLATPTDDKGFLLHYQVTNGRLAYQKFDSNAVFQYGFTQPANQIYTSTQRFGKVFSLLVSGHEDSLRLQKINMATGAVEINRKIGGPQYGTIGYFNYAPYHFVATQDSGLLVVLSRWQSYNWTVGMDVAMIKLNKTLNVQYIRFGGWQNSQSIVSRLVKEHSDGTIWHMTAVNNPQAIGYQLNIVRINGATGATVNQITLGNMVNPTINGFTELPGRVVLSGLSASNEGWVMSMAPDLSTIHWYKRYGVPLNYAGAYEMNVGPNGNLYGHMGDKVICLRPSDGSVVWAVDVNGGSKVVPKFKLGTHKMLALHNPGGSGLTVTVMDSLGQGLCNTVGFTVPVTAYTTTSSSYNFASYGTAGLSHFTLTNPSTNAVTGSSTVVCTAICNFTAAFSSSVNVLTGNFAGQPTGLSSYHWTFGDGGTSTSPSPTHTYSSPGTYTVCLIGTSGCMSDTVCQQVTVTCTATNASFSSSANQQTVAFTNGSSGSGPLAYSWDFGDGGGSTAASPSHTYSTPGYYVVCLIATGPCGSDTICSLVNAGCVSTVAGFSSTSNQLAANFTNSSTGAGVLTYSWAFGDGGTSTSSNPSHTYATSGAYTVCLIATGPCGADTSCQQVTISCPLPVSAFTATSNLLNASFSNSSTGGFSYTWDFGDGNTSTLSNPTHGYAAAGTYNVCLIATGPCGADTSCQQVTISCPPPVAGFNPFISSPLVVYFFNTSNSPGIIVNQWDFGDGLTSLQGNPQHIYAQPGDYLVCLTVITSCGSNTFCDTVTVTCPPLTAAMGSSGNFPTIQFTDMTVGTPGQWSWDFGDGGFSTSQNPSHTYGSAGIYTVCLVASDGCSSDTTCQSVDVLLGIHAPSALGIELYPVPATDHTWVSWQMPGLPMTVRVATLDGRVMFAAEKCEAGILLDVRDWPQGVYAVEVKADGWQATRKLVVLH